MSSSAVLIADLIQSKQLAAAPGGRPAIAEARESMRRGLEGILGRLGQQYGVQVSQHESKGDNIEFRFTGAGLPALSEVAVRAIASALRLPSIGGRFRFTAFAADAGISYHPRYGAYENLLKEDANKPFRVVVDQTLSSSLGGHSAQWILARKPRTVDVPYVGEPILGVRAHLCVFEDDVPALPEIPSDKTTIQIPSAASPSPSRSQTAGLIILRDGDGTEVVMSCPSVKSKGSLNLRLIPETPQASRFLSKLRERSVIFAAYGLKAVGGVVTEISHEVDAGVQTWEAEIEARQQPLGHAGMEMSTSGMSADDIAELRARRILLNEGAPGRGPKRRMDHNDELLESMVQGMGTPIQAQVSPLPKLYKELEDDPATFLDIGKLTLVLHLVISGAVETVEVLDLQLHNGQATIRFEGTRRRVYSNQPATIISVDGICHLK